MFLCGYGDRGDRSRMTLHGVVFVIKSFVDWNTGSVLKLVCRATTEMYVMVRHEGNKLRGSLSIRTVQPPVSDAAS